MGLYDEFRFHPAPWLPHSDLPLEELERIRNIKREDMEYTNENGYSVRVVIDPTLCMVQDMFRERELQKHLEVRLDAGEEQQHHRRDRTEAVELGRDRKRRVRARGDRRVGEGLQLGAAEEAVLEDPRAEADSAKRPRTDGNARAEFAEDARQPHQRGQHAAELRREEDDADLQRQEHHLGVEIQAPSEPDVVGEKRRFRAEDTRRRQDEGGHQNQFLVSHIH